jgi:hypothetical protein
MQKRRNAEMQKCRNRSAGPFGYTNVETCEQHYLSSRSDAYTSSRNTGQSRMGAMKHWAISDGSDGTLGNFGWERQPPWGLLIGHQTLLRWGKA